MTVTNEVAIPTARRSSIAGSLASSTAIEQVAAAPLLSEDRRESSASSDRSQADQPGCEANASLSKEGSESRRCESVHQARSRDELDAVYRFRYRVYFEEFGRYLGQPDHDRHMVIDADDEKPTTTILYTGTPEQITGTVRLRHWSPGEVPQHDVDELSLDRFPDLADRRIAEIGRLMVRRSLRGQRIVEALLRRSYEVLVGGHEVDLTFCYCSPGLVRYYQRLAMRPYGGRPVAAPDGLMVPLVAVNSDLDYYVRHRSPLAPVVRRFWERPGRQRLDLAPYRGLFGKPEGTELKADRLRRAVERFCLDVPESQAARCLAAMPPKARNRMVDESMILDAPDGLLMTRKGFREQELYLVLDGRFVIEEGVDVGREFGVGDLFGSDTLRSKSSNARRASSVRSVCPGRVLVLPGKLVQRALRQLPQLAQVIAESPSQPRSAETVGSKPSGTVTFGPSLTARRSSHSVAPTTEYPMHELRPTSLLETLAGTRSPQARRAASARVHSI